MSAPERRTVPPIVCKPWCMKGDGHPGEMGPADQRCTTTPAEVVMSLLPKTDYDDGNWYARHLDVFAEASPESPDAVVIAAEAVHDEDHDLYLRLTTREARTLAAELVAGADAIDGAR